MKYKQNTSVRKNGKKNREKMLKRLDLFLMISYNEFNKAADM